VQWAFSILAFERGKLYTLITYKFYQTFRAIMVLLSTQINIKFRKRDTVMKPKKAKVIEAAQALLPELQIAVDSINEQLNQGKTYTSARVAGLLLSGKYILSTYETLTRLVEGGSIDYQALYESINLEMVANSNAWSSLRYYARQMTL
jgi:hypothetical protein